MALARIHNWISLEALSASDLNAEFTNILNYLNSGTVALTTLTVSGTSTFTGNIVSDLLFTDATYDIGKTGATRPRDAFLSRNLTVGGTAAVTGTITLASATTGTQAIGTSGASGTDISLNIGSGGGNFFRVYNGASAWLQISGTGSMSVAATAVTFGSVSTTASAANAFLDNAASNSLLRSTSSIRYKTDVQYFGSERSGSLIDELKPMTYRSLSKADDAAQVHYGLLAEDLAQVEPALVQWTAADKAEAAPEYLAAHEVSGKVPDGVQYERIVCLLIAEVQGLRARLKAAGIA